MILVALGANLPSRIGPPRETLEAALARFGEHGMTIVKRSNWYRSAPVPASTQPDFINGVCQIESGGSAAEILRKLHSIEDAFDRTRSSPNAARTIDLDLLDVDRQVSAGWPILPHPRLQDRLFVLLPLREVAPRWRHPQSGRSIGQMIAAIPASRDVSLLPMGLPMG